MKYIDHELTGKYIAGYRESLDDPGVEPYIEDLDGYCIIEINPDDDRDDCFAVLYIYGPQHMSSSESEMILEACQGTLDTNNAGDSFIVTKWELEETTYRNFNGHWFLRFKPIECHATLAERERWKSRL